MHALLWVARTFPGKFDNMIFLAVGQVDAQNWEGAKHIEHLRQTVSSSLAYYIAQSRHQGFATDYRIEFVTCPMDELMRLTEATMEEFPNSLCFASKLVFKRVNFLSAWLHNRIPAEIQKRLQSKGRRMVLLPMKIG
jgi:hypothetical protein